MKPTDTDLRLGHHLMDFAANSRALSEWTTDERVPGDAKPKAYLALGNCSVRRFNLSPTPTVIGSGKNCDVVFPPEAGVAERHAVVWLAGSEVVLSAPDTSAPVTVSGRRMSFARLDDGDAICLGEVSLSVHVREGSVTSPGVTCGPEATSIADQPIADESGHRATATAITLLVRGSVDQRDLLLLASQLERHRAVSELALVRAETGEAWFAAGVASMEALLAALGGVDGLTIESSTVHTSIVEARISEAVDAEQAPPTRPGRASVTSETARGSLEVALV